MYNVIVNRKITK